MSDDYDPTSCDRWIVEWRRPDSGRLIWCYDFIPAMHTAIPEPNMAHGIILPPWKITVRRVATPERAVIDEESESFQLDEALGDAQSLYEALVAVMDWDVEHDHPALSYVTVQVDRDAIDKARFALEVHRMATQR